MGLAVTSSIRSLRTRRLNLTLGVSFCYFLVCMCMYMCMCAQLQVVSVSVSSFVLNVQRKRSYGERDQDQEVQVQKMEIKGKQTTSSCKTKKQSQKQQKPQQQQQQAATSHMLPPNVKWNLAPGIETHFYTDKTGSIFMRTEKPKENGSQGSQMNQNVRLDLSLNRSQKRNCKSGHSRYEYRKSRGGQQQQFYRNEKQMQMCDTDNHNFGGYTYTYKQNHNFNQHQNQYSNHNQYIRSQKKLPRHIFRQNRRPSSNLEQFHLSHHQFQTQIQEKGQQSLPTMKQQLQQILNEITRLEQHQVPKEQKITYQYHQFQLEYLKLQYSQLHRQIYVLETNSYSNSCSQIQIEQQSQSQSKSTNNEDNDTGELLDIDQIIAQVNRRARNPNYTYSRPLNVNVNTDTITKSTLPTFEELKAELKKKKQQRQLNNAYNKFSLDYRWYFRMSQTCHQLIYKMQLLKQEQNPNFQEMELWKQLAFQIKRAQEIMQVDAEVLRALGRVNCFDLEEQDERSHSKSNSKRHRLSPVSCATNIRSIVTEKLIPLLNKKKQRLEDEFNLAYRSYVTGSKNLSPNVDSFFEQEKAQAQFKSIQDIKHQIQFLETQVLKFTVQQVLMQNSPDEHEVSCQCQQQMQNQNEQKTQLIQTEQQSQSVPVDELQCQQAQDQEKQILLLTKEEILQKLQKQAVKCQNIASKLYLPMPVQVSQKIADLRHKLIDQIKSMQKTYPELDVKFIF